MQIIFNNLTSGSYNVNGGSVELQYSSYSYGGGSTSGVLYVRAKSVMFAGCGKERLINNYGGLSPSADPSPYTGNQANGVFFNTTSTITTISIRSYTSVTNGSWTFDTGTTISLYGVS